MYDYKADDICTGTAYSFYLCDCQMGNFYTRKEENIYLYGY